MVFSTTDLDTATADTTHRVDVSFLNSTNPTEAFPAVSYTHLPSPRDRTRSRMPSSA